MKLNLIYFRLLLLLLILQTTVTQAQNKESLIITYDFSSQKLSYQKINVKKDKDDKKATVHGQKSTDTVAKENLNNKLFLVGDRGFVKIIIKNVNPFIYNLKITELQNIRLDESKLFENNNSTSFNTIMYDLSDIVFNDINISTPNASYSNRFVTEKTNVIDTLNSSIRSEEQILIEKNDSIRITDNDSVHSSRIHREMEKINFKLALLYKQKQSLEKEKENLIKDATDVNDKVLLYKEKADTLLNDIRNLNDIALFYRVLTNEIPVLGSSDAIARKQTLFQAVFPALILTPNTNLTIELNKLISKTVKSYSSLVEYYFSILNTEGLGSRDDLGIQLKDSYSQVKSLYAQVKTAELIKFVDHISRLYNSINPEIYQMIYHASIINDDADFIKFTIEGVPVDGVSSDIFTKSLKIALDVPIKGGVKIDLSTGLLNTFGLFNKSYRYEKVNNSQGTYRIRENEQKSLLNPNLGLLLHVYRRNSYRSFRFAGSVGIGLSDDQNVRYFGGASGIFGKKQRFIISLGAVAGQVTYADNSILNKNLMLSEDDLLNPIPTRTPSPYRIGAFLGITFNLTGNNKSFSGKVDNRGL